MNYLAQLKALNFDLAHGGEPSKPSKAAFEPFEGNSPTCNSENATPDHLAERAAIIQEGAGVPADWADGFAQLEAWPIPRGVDGAAWTAMIDAAGRFLDKWGSKAHALGWTAGELFGLDVASPIGRRDRRRAAFYLTSAEVVAITAEAITLKIGGAVQWIRRRGGPTVPAWEAVA